MAGDVLGAGGAAAVVGRFPSPFAAGARPPAVAVFADADALGGGGVLSALAVAAALAVGAPVAGGGSVVAPAAARSGGSGEEAALSLIPLVAGGAAVRFA